MKDRTQLNAKTQRRKENKMDYNEKLWIMTIGLISSILFSLRLCVFAFNCVLSFLSCRLRSYVSCYFSSLRLTCFFRSLDCSSLFKRGRRVRMGFVSAVFVARHLTLGPFEQILFRFRWVCCVQ